MEEKSVLTCPPPVWIRIDLNARSRDGHTLARMSDASSAVVAGDQRVIVHEPDDGVAAPATVVRVDTDRGLVYLDVSWAEIDDDTAFGWVTVPMLTYVQEPETNGASDLSMRFGFMEWLRASFLPAPQTSRGTSAATPLPIHTMVTS